MKRFGILIAVVALLVPIVLMAQSGPAPMAHAGQGKACCGPGGMHRGGAMMERGMGMGMRGPGGAGGFLGMADELQLTDQQKDKLKGMQSQFRLANVDRDAALEKAQIRLSDLLRDQGAVADVNRAIDDVAKLRADMEKARYAHMQEMKAVLTPDQVKKMKDLREEHREDRGKMMRGGMRGAMPGGTGESEDDDGN